jgi:hypothetical protein
MFKKEDIMGTRTLAEAIILQSMEDLFHPAHRKESVEFFNGEGFRTCAELARLSPADCKRIFELCGLPCPRHIGKEKAGVT